MIKLWAICRNTFTQAVRQPAFAIVVMIFMVSPVIILPLTGWTMSSNYRESDQRMFESFGLSNLLLGGLLLAAFSASSALSREIEDRTALTVISKPVGRGVFVLGKFLGVFAAVTVGFYLMSLVFLMAVRHRATPSAGDPIDWPVIVLGVSAFAAALLLALAGNYFFGWPFISAAVYTMLLLMSLAMAAILFVGKGWQLVSPGYDAPGQLAIHPPLLVGILMTFMAVTIFVAVAVAASTRLGQVMTLLVCIAVLLIGSEHPYLFGYWAERMPVARLFAWVVPNLTYFYVLDAISRGDEIPIAYAAQAGLYCLVYVAGVLAVGMALFHRRSLEAEGASASMPGPVGLMNWAGKIASVAAALAGIIMLSLREFHHAGAILLAVGLIVLSAVNWWLWSAFARGARWAWFTAGGILVLLVAGGVLLLVPTGWFAPEQIDPIRIGGGVLAMLAVGGGVILLLPRTRRHFRPAA